ncbi:multicopper oxidase domain-containing protein [Halorientalis marina]|uniref:multicopper oxidase domain-containing protein n=1 Tax=Halorientalis marina TaxID=2931976 RepID=UPI001FF0F1E8|nr:multicopper oxidase domain-containing protein [Halorientalis marina]
MSDQMSAPGTPFSRRDFVKATGATGLAAIAGCQVPADPNTMTETAAETTATTTETAAGGSQDLPAAGKPEVVDLAEQNNEVTLSTRPARLPAHPGEAMGGPIELPRVWAFQADDRQPSVPGPILRAQEGDTVEVLLDNTDGMRPHTIHFHGSQTSWENDGVPTSTGITVQPGEQHTYEIPANVPGTHLYHCHYQTHNHIEMGMYGIFRVDPDGYEEADREYFMTLKDWDSRLPRTYAGEDVTYSARNRRPDVFTINGRSAPRTLHPEDGSPLIVSQGDTVRVHMVNSGYMSHPMHTHNHRFRVVEKDGTQLPDALQYERDVTNIAPAERHTIEFEADADPGIYLTHCHKVNHVTNGLDDAASYPGGMLTGIVYEDAMDTDIFAELMDYAGYEG